MYKTTIKGQEITVNEHEDWKTSISEDFKPGDYVDGEIAWSLINALPPASFCSGYFQVGEAHSHRRDKMGIYKPTFCTMKKVQNKPEVWQYLGNCFFLEETNQN